MQVFTNPKIIPRLVEWMEMLSILGMDKVFFYYYDLGPEIMAMMDYYQQKGKVDLR